MTVLEETKIKEDLEGLKGRLEKMDSTTDDYREQYGEYIQSLQDMEPQLKVDIDTTREQREQLEKMKCPDVVLSPIDGYLQDLVDLQMWVEFESDPFTLQLLQPLAAPHFKPLP